MTIEFHNPADAIPEWIIGDIKKKLTDLHHQDKEISRAQVYFQKQPVAFDGDYVCEIELTIFGSSIMVHRNADSYALASREVLKELSEQVQKQIQKQNELPDEIVSTVDI
ncbi:MAG: hypothetical protein ACHQD8_02140 [Chitinophagales bacterium]